MQENAMMKAGILRKNCYRTYPATEKYLQGNCRITLLPAFISKHAPCSTLVGVELNQHHSSTTEAKLV